MIPNDVIHNAQDDCVRYFAEFELACKCLWANQKYEGQYVILFPSSTDEGPGVWGVSLSSKETLCREEIAVPVPRCPFLC